MKRTTSVTIQTASRRSTSGLTAIIDMTFLRLVYMMLTFDITAENPLGVYPKNRTFIIGLPTAGTKWQHVVNAYNQVVRAGYPQVRYEKIDSDGVPPPHKDTK